MKKSRFLLVIVLIIIVISGCFNQENEKKSDSYKIDKYGKSTVLVADKELSGVEIVLGGKVEEKDIAIFPGLLKIVRSGEDKSMVSIAGDIEMSSKIVEFKENIDIVSIVTVEERKGESSTKRAGEVLLGDFDLSGTVDLNDFMSFAKGYGTFLSQYDIAPATAGTGVWADIYCFATPDGAVNLSDFIIFAKNYNKKNPVVNTTKVYKHGDMVELTGNYGINDVTKTFLGGMNGMIETKTTTQRMLNGNGWTFDDVGGPTTIAIDAKRGKVLFTPEDNKNYNATRIFDPGFAIPEQRYFYKAHYVRNVLLLDGEPYKKSYQWKHERVNWEKKVSDGDCEIKVHNWPGGGGGVITFINRSPSDKSTYWGGYAADTNSDWTLLEIMVFTGTQGMQNGKMVTRAHKNGKTYISHNRQSEKIYADPQLRLRYFVEQNYFGNFGQIEDGVDNTMPKPQIREIYSDDSSVIVGNRADMGWKRVELRDSVDLKTATVREIQDWKSWDGNISLELNTGGIAKGEHDMYLVVIDGIDENGWDNVAGYMPLRIRVE